MNMVPGNISDDNENRQVILVFSSKWTGSEIELKYSKYQKTFCNHLAEEGVKNPYAYFQGINKKGFLPLIHLAGKSRFYVARKHVTQCLSH